MVATLHSAGMVDDQQMLQSIGSQRSKRQRSNWQHSWLFRWVHSMVLTDNKSFGVHFSLAQQSHNDFQGESGTTFPLYLRSSPWLNTQDLLCINHLVISIHFSDTPWGSHGSGHSCSRSCRRSCRCGRGGSCRDCTTRSTAWNAGTRSASIRGLDCWGRQTVFLVISWFPL